MDHGMNAGSPPARTDSQFLAQLPELAETLIAPCESIEGRLSVSQSAQIRESLRGWSALEALARESLHERARDAARAQAEVQRQKDLDSARTARPNLPRRTVHSSLRSQALKALDDPSLIGALRQWTLSRNSKKP